MLEPAERAGMRDVVRRGVLHHGGPRFPWCAVLADEGGAAAAWAPRLAAVRAEGFDAVLVDLAWERHRVATGWDLAGPRALLQAAREVGLMVLVRPSAAAAGTLEHWLGALAKDALAPEADVVAAVVLLGDGVTGADAQALGPGAGLAPGAAPAYAAFLAERYGTLEAYNAAHGTACARWEDAPAPLRLPAAAATRREMLACLDRAGFAHALVAGEVRRWRGALRAGGLGDEVPLLVAAGPGGETVPGTLDRWYTLVTGPFEDAAWAHGDTPDPMRPEARLAFGRAPGPALGLQRDLASAAAALGRGATGLAAKPGFLRAELLAAYLAAEGPGLARAPRAASLAWALYAPYAWAGAWAPPTGRDPRPWLAAGFRAAPRLGQGPAALAETARATGLDWGQVDLLGAPDEELARWPMLALAGFDLLDADAQRRLVAYVEDGGQVLLTGLVPRWGLALERGPMPLREALFPHARERAVRLKRPVAVVLEGGARARASGIAVHVEPPADAAPVAWVGADCVGYRRSHGDGSATYLGFAPWSAAERGDDAAMAEANRGVAAWALGQAGLRARWAWAEQPGVEAWQRSGPGDVQHLAVVSHASQPLEAEVRFTRANGQVDALRLALPMGGGALVTFHAGQPRSLLLQGLAFDQAMAPRLDAEGRRWGADAPCDLAVAALPGGILEVRIAGAPEVEVALGVPARLVERVTCGGRVVATRAGRDEGLRFRAATAAGPCRVHLRPGAHAWWVGPEMERETVASG